jgi:hypothetical protein
VHWCILEIHEILVIGCYSDRFVIASVFDVPESAPIDTSNIKHKKKYSLVFSPQANYTD